jgi:hypothetical protein
LPLGKKLGRMHYRYLITEAAAQRFSSQNTGSRKKVEHIKMGIENQAFM